MTIAFELLMHESLSWAQVIAEVRQRLEAIRLEEMRRRAGKLYGMSEEQRAMLDRLTRSLMRAVVEKIEEAPRQRGGMSHEGPEVIREMFAARDGRVGPLRTRGIVRPGMRASLKS